MNVSEKAAHLKGLMEGMEYDLNTKEGKLFAAIADLLEDLALTVCDIEDDTAMINDYIEELDEDLGEVERIVYDIYDDEDYDEDYDEDDDEDDECCCDDEDCDCCDEVIELTCPNCGEIISIDSDEIDEIDTVECPSCDKVLSVVKGDEDETEDDESKD
ncbi:MAG TPA: zinc ribbon domain-containing protein [Clostridiales bacterium]|nr:zinc ribbon domain-containing protein [Eubacteriales bacterium]HBR32421.1 zinc ribbon domain-containing protein [Clostridiales bacterium]